MPELDVSGRDRPLSVVDRIKEYILLNQLAPGSPLPTEKELSEQLSVSRSGIREAMKTLSALDIVEVRHGYGTYVGQMGLTAMVQSLAFRGMLNAGSDHHVLADLIDVRQLIETSLAETIIDSLSPQAALTMRRLTTTMEEKADRGEDFRAEDRQFHLILMQTTGNALAVELTGAFWDVHAVASHSLGPNTDLHETARAHIAILDAIERGDAEQFRTAIRDHYVPVRARMVENQERP
ncbi:FadR family transcriptional regulator [Antrihabitans cavernicola]|uniref:FadR family transcriptional regulator n=2 Tax=Antrihabitans cavernicola TaxID=2495913 RepID=A0A5A7S6L1_9NOCA|nr:FadR family transcriptional regulator [Spelaeibacter cavernicola]